MSDERPGEAYPDPRRRPMRWTFVGDVGGAGSYHVGDEAMLESNLRLFRSIEARDTLYAISADPAFTAKAYGVEACLLYTSPSPRDGLLSRMPSSA